MASLGIVPVEHSYHLLEGDPRLPVEPHHALVEACPVVADDLAQIMERAMEIACAFVEILLGPELVDDLLAMERAPRRQRQQLEEVGRPSPFPCVRRQQSAVSLDLEPAEQL